MAITGAEPGGMPTKVGPGDALTSPCWPVTEAKASNANALPTKRILPPSSNNERPFLAQSGRWSTKLAKLECSPTHLQVFTRRQFVALERIMSRGSSTIQV
jgi:hypothetical protein